MQSIPSPPCSLSGHFGFEDEIVPTCRELSILGLSPIAPSVEAFLCGTFNREELVQTDFRIKNAPRLVGENFKNNEKPLERVRQIAERKGRTMNQLALAWVQHQGANVVPIPGTTKIANRDSNSASFGVQLSSEELEDIANAFPPSQVASDRTLHMSITYQHVSTPPKAKGVRKRANTIFCMQFLCHCCQSHQVHATSYSDGCDRSDLVWSLARALCVMNSLISALVTCKFSIVEVFFTSNQQLTAANVGYPLFLSRAVPWIHKNMEGSFRSYARCIPDILCYQS